MCDNIFIQDFNLTFDKISQQYDNVLLFGDLNYNMLDKEKCTPLSSMCDVFEYTNLVKNATCFTKNAEPTLIDVILTNKPNLCQNVSNFNCGLSDCHNIISVQLKGYVPKIKRDYIKYRSFKNLDQEKFLEDLNTTNFETLIDTDDVNKAYSNFQSAFAEVIDKHMPIKQRKPIQTPAPYMNSNLRNAIYKKRMYHNKFLKNKADANWELYRKQRNFVNKLKKNSIKTYFYERTAGGPKSTDFYSTIKPFLSSKGVKGSNNIILHENDKIGNDAKEVSEMFNNFFINVAKDIGDKNIAIDENHPSIVKINENKSEMEELVFRPVEECFVNKQINKLNIKKATGCDGISPKIMKLAQPMIVTPIKTLINKSIESSVFPDKLKQAQVTPLYKKNNNLDKSNYRPVSVLPCISKIYERAIHDQLMEFLENHFDPLLSAFRSGFGCQTALLKIIEEWKKALDNNLHIAAILMDLSKAFDCLPHNLLLLKLKAYGLNESSLKLMNSYLENRQQCIKLGSTCSTWLNLFKGVPQGSILGPVLFNVFINDIFLFVNNSTIYNYADDNTVSKCDTNLENVISDLEEDNLTLIKWFSINLMKANPDKFQAIAIGKKTKQHNISFDLNGIKINCEEIVKLLGVTIDSELNFDNHISETCKKASRQLNILKRMGKYLNRLGRLTAYYSFILSNFNYCPIIWHYCSEKNSKNMERIQERALRFIYGDYENTYDFLLEKSKLPALKVRRLRTIAVETFKIVNKISPSYLHNLIEIKGQSYNFRSQKTANIPRVNTTRYGKKSFRFNAAQIWNELPNHCRQETSLEQFRKLIQTWDPGNSSCQCCACI